MARNGLSTAGDGKTSTRLNVGQMKSYIKGKEYWIHPVYDDFGANKQGEVINIYRGIPRKGSYINTGYLKATVSSSRNKKQKTVKVHRFVYECHNGIIPEGLVIDHINDKKDDNRLCNLQLMSQQQNCKKSAKNFDSSFFAIRRNGKRVKAINLKTNKVSYYKSLYSAQQYLGIDRSAISMCCRGIQKTSKSKNNGCRYKFEFV